MNKNWWYDTNDLKRDFKCKLKRKLTHNKAEVNATGGGIYKQLQLSPLEEAAVTVGEILTQNMSDFNVTILENEENMASTSATVREGQENTNQPTF